MKLTIYDLRFTRLRDFLATLLLCAFALNGRATPFFYQGYKSDGSFNTNQVGVTFFPTTDQPFTIYGTNIVYGGNILTISPNTSGYSSNWIFPGVYKFIITNLNAAFIANIPDTTNFNALALYVTNVQSFSGVGLNSYGVMTNQLGFPPATNTTSGIETALGYVPATNNNAGILFALGYTPATNTYAGIMNSLGFAPATNSFIGGTNQFGYMPATNTSAGVLFALGYTPATNTFNGVTNSLGYMPATNGGAIAISQLPYTPATNSAAGIKAALNYTPGTNYVGQSSVASFTTNGLLVWIAYQTNAVPGPAYTNFPPGSLLTTTNGAFFVLSNLVWTAK
jgi:hypothetical protein